MRKTEGFRNAYKRILIVLAVSAMATSGVAHAVGGTVDPTFGYRGMAVVDLPGKDYAWKVALQPDGKVVLAGFANQKLGVVRLTANGHPDPTFSGDGRTTIPLGSYEFPFGLATTTDGSIIVGSYVESWRRYTGNPLVDLAPQVALDGSRFALAKLRPNGSLDPSFGSGGIFLSQPDQVRPLDDVPVGLALTPAGRIIVLAMRGGNAGYFGYPTGIVLMQFTPEGKLDPTFGVGGTAAVSYAGALPDPSGLAVLPDGRILVGMTLEEVSILLLPPSPVGDYVLARYLPSGLLDATFGNGGFARPATFGGPEFPWGLALQPNGKIIVFGQTWDAGPFTASMMRLNSDGSIDQYFGQKGVATLAISPGSNFRGVALQPDGSIVAAVNGYGTNGVARFRSNGSRDPSFGSGGYRPIPLAIISEVAVQRSRIIAVGGLTSDPPDRFAAVGLTR